MTDKLRKLRDEMLANYHALPRQRQSFRNGFNYCYSLMDEREKVLVDALKRYAEANEVKGYLHPSDLAREALAKLEA